MNRQAVLHYLNCPHQGDDKTNQLIDECYLEVQEYARFKVVHHVFELIHNPLTIKTLDFELSSQDLAFYFQSCHACCVIACTLGIQIDRRIKYYEHIDMAKAVVFDAVSSAYLEECCDAYEKELDLGPHTFRFAPGYGDIPIHWNRSLSRVLDVEKRLGVTMTPSDLFVPMKSMLGLIGIGISQQKTCLSCARIKTCSWRKEGQRCYVID